MKVSIPKTIVRALLVSTCVSGFLFNCTSERGVNSRSAPEDRVYAFSTYFHPIYCYAVDDTSHRVIDSITGLVGPSGLYQMEISPDGRWLYLGRGPGTDIAKVDVDSKKVVDSVFGMGMFTLSGTGDTLIAYHGNQTYLFRTSDFSLIREIPNSIYPPERCDSKPWVVGGVWQDSQITVYDFERDSVIAQGICRDLAGKAWNTGHVSIDPRGERLWAIAIQKAVVIDIQTWTTVADYWLYTPFGQVSFGNGGAVAYIPDAGDAWTSRGKILVVSTTDFRVLDTIDAVNMNCNSTPQAVNYLAGPSPLGRMYGVSTIGLRSSHLLMLDAQSSQTIGWITPPNGCMPFFTRVAVGPIPPASD